MSILIFCSLIDNAFFQLLNIYMEKSKEVLANGQETEGAKYQGKVLNRKKKLYYGVLRIIIRPLRQLL